MFTDFEYDNQKLSDYGCIICRIVTGTGTNTSSLGNQLSFTTIKRGKKFKKVASHYDSVYTSTFEICKYSKNGDNIFTMEEVAALVRWLNKDDYYKFKIICPNEDIDVYYMATFNVEKITLGDNIIGLKLALETDAPFGYYEEVECVMEFPTGTEENSVFDISDEIGYIYPSKVTIECLSDGKLTIHNSQDGLRSTVIDNCVSGEILTLDGENKIIISSEPHERLYNDFNYNYIRISNKKERSTEDIRNLFTVSMPCNISFTYSPIAKIGMV